ncbi:MAG TPA: aromatic amino acid lyase [Casimicrobiaceae bacterium]|jgi:histidine ammonia-lyase
MTVRVGERPLAIADLVRVARGDEAVELTTKARERVAAARAIVERLAASSEPIYGLNSALGANTGATLAADDLAEYQLRAIRARAVAVGKPYDRESVRAILFARIAGMAQGGSGVSPVVLDQLCELLNRDVIPVVPRIGSISVADLPQLAHLALVLVGEGDADYRGERLKGRDALVRAGLSPVSLGAKDGVALISANAATVGRAALVVFDALAVHDAWLMAIALSFEAFRANLSILDARVLEARPARGQIDVGATLRALLEGSALLERGAARRVQDPLSLRVVPQVHGALHWMVGETREQIEIELNSAAESPLLVDDDTMRSNGNFHVPALATAIDAAALAFAQASSLAVERCIKFMSPVFTDLPLQLTRHGPAHSGFATVQKTLAALWGEIRRLANPASLDYMPVSAGIEDHATQALAAVEKLATLVDRVRYLVAIELVIAAQALDLRGIAVASLGSGPLRAYARVREAVPMLDGDRPLGPDIDRAEALVRGGVFGRD